MFLRARTSSSWSQKKRSLYDIFHPLSILFNVPQIKKLKETNYNFDKLTSGNDLHLTKSVDIRPERKKIFAILAAVLRDDSKQILRDFSKTIEGNHCCSSFLLSTAK